MLIIMYTRGICTFWNLLGPKAHRQYMRSAQRNEQEESRMKYGRCRRRGQQTQRKASCLRRHGTKRMYYDLSVLIRARLPTLWVSQVHMQTQL